MKLVGEFWGRGVRTSIKWALFSVLFLTCLAEPSSARAEGAGVSKKVAVGFSNLVARLDNDEIGFAKAEYRVHILEALREAGFNAVGAESLVFGKDEAERADVVLGGTVKELKCQQVHGELRCSVGIEWELLDLERDEVVYRVMSRFIGRNLPGSNDSLAGKTLTLGALRSLLSRERFKTLLNAERTALPDDADYPPASFGSCEVKSRELPAAFEAIADGTLIIKSGGGIGSGFVLTADGLVMTAAHVVTSGKLEVHTHDGKTLPARVVRISRKQDVALLSLGTLDKLRPCLAIQVTPQTPGTDVYAIGSPAGEQLGFSLSRGIVSGLRTISDVPLIQTDASLSPGNSGGPLVDRQGRVVGVVSRKIAGHAVEGLGFAIPIQAGLLALKLEQAAQTSPSLQQAPPSSAPVSKTDPNDKPDPIVAIDPEGDRESARTLAATRRKHAQEDDYARRVQEQKANTPGFIKPMRWAGLGIGIAGFFGILYSGLPSNDYVTRSTYESRRLANDVSWTGFIVGSAAFTTSFFLTPKLKPSSVGRAPSWSVAAGPADLKLNVSFQ